MVKYNSTYKSIKKSDSIILFEDTWPQFSCFFQ